jgi:hypothetical protein
MLPLQVHTKLRVQHCQEKIKHSGTFPGAPESQAFSTAIFGIIAHGVGYRAPHPKAAQPGPWFSGSAGGVI